METSGFHDDDDNNSYCVVFEVMISSSLVDEYIPFGACRRAIMTEANARIVLLSKWFLMLQMNTASFKCQEPPTQ